MFLALNEIKHSKLRYALVVSVMFLIAYLVFFLSGLAYGLAQKYQTSIDKWQADQIILSDQANDNLMMSMIPITSYDKIEASQKAGLRQAPGIIILDNEDNQKVTVSFFGIDEKTFISPDVTEGKSYGQLDEAVADLSLKTQYKLKLGDKVVVSGSDQKVTIVGFSDKSSYSASPVLYISPETYQKLELSANRGSKEDFYNAVISKGKISYLPSGLQKLSVSAFINKLPGYNAQVLTFSFMIGFLVLIAAVVIAIFIYVLTIQKISIFGILKAQGISSFYIAKSVIWQTFILASFGVFVGLLATVASSLILPAAVPFEINPIFYSAISVVMILVAIVGAVFSVKTVVAIDPLKAIS